jgi:hypothetical protein
MHPHLLREDLPRVKVRPEYEAALALCRDIRSAAPGQTVALALHDKGVPVPDIAAKLTIKTGKDAVQNPSAASVYHALADADEQTADPGQPCSEGHRPAPISARRLLEGRFGNGRAARSRTPRRCTFRGIPAPVTPVTNR